MKKFCFVVLTIAMTWTDEGQASSLLNVGRTKLAYHSCSMTIDKNSVVTDGLIDPYKFELIDVTCSMEELIRINVKISEVKNIGSVIVHSGSCPECDGLLDYFLVKLFSSTDFTSKGIKLCGQYNGKFQDPGKPMRVNCDVQKTYDEKMGMVGIFPNQYQKTVSKKSAISEIDIYLLEYSQNLAFYGCYKEFEGQDFPSGGGCRAVCAQLGYRFMARSLDGDCKCGSKVPKGMLTIKKCMNYCPEKNIICAEKGAYAVYIALAPHIFSHGCYEVPTSGFSVHVSDMTSIYCIKICSKKNYAFSYASTDTCYCTTVVTEDKKDAHLCNQICPGDDSMCGGREVVSVYSGCMDNSDQSPCTSVYNCEDENINHFGKCLGRCKTKWLGQYCLTRELPKPPPSNRPSLPFSPTRGQRGGLSVECRQTIKAFLSKKTTSPPRQKCVGAVKGTKGGSGVHPQIVILTILMSTVVACVTGVFSGLWFAKANKLSQMKEESQMEEAQVAQD